MVQMWTTAVGFRWWAHEKSALGSRSPLIFDMACGASPPYLLNSCTQTRNFTSIRQVTEFLLFAVSDTQRHIIDESGEVTIAAYEWWKRGVSGISPSKKGIAYPPQTPGPLSTKMIDGLEGGSSNPTIKRVPDDLSITATDPVSVYIPAEGTPRRELTHSRMTAVYPGGLHGTHHLTLRTAYVSRNLRRVAPPHGIECDLGRG